MVVAMWKEGNESPLMYIDITWFVVLIEVIKCLQFPASLGNEVLLIAA